MRRHTKRILCYVIGLIIVSLGISLTIEADVGVGAWDALNVGLSNIAFSVGTWVIIIGITLMFVNAFLTKKIPDFVALITIFIIGPFIDMWLYLFKSFEINNIWFQYALLLIGLIILGLGVSIYLQAKFAPNPVDNLMIALHKRFHIKLGVAKTIGELIALILAIIVKGPIWIGTIFVTFLIGPIIQFFYPKVEKLIYKEQ